MSSAPRPPRVLPWLVIAGLAPGCATQHQAIVATVVGVGVTALGVLAVRASLPADDPPSGPIALVLGGGIVTVVSGITAASWNYHDPLGDPPGATADPDAFARRARARSLTIGCARAAAAGQCASVHDVERYVRAYDPDLYDQVFLRDAAIQRCLARQVP
jgi:hypothetical protein